MNPIRKAWDATWDFRKRLGLTRKRPIPLLKSDLTPAELAVLCESFDLLRPTTYLEVGVFWGGSFKRVLEHRDAAGLKTRCIGLDLWDEVRDRQANTHVSGRPNRRKVEEALRAAGLGGFELLAGNCSDLDRLFTEPVEVAFHDANHTYRAVLDDATAIGSRLVPGGRLLVHNAGRDRMPDKLYVEQDGGPNRAVNELAQSGAWELLEIRDRMAVLRKTG